MRLCCGAKKIRSGGQAARTTVPGDAAVAALSATSLAETSEVRLGPEVEDIWDIPDESSLHEVCEAFAPRPALGPRLLGGPRGASGELEPAGRWSEALPRLRGQLRAGLALEAAAELRERGLLGEAANAGSLSSASSPASGASTSSRASSWGRSSRGSSMLTIARTIRSGATKDTDSTTCSTPTGLRASCEFPPLVESLRVLDARLHATMAATLACAGRPDMRWARVEVRDPKVGPDFELEMKIRFARDSERQERGPSAQLVVSCDCRGFPLRLSELVAFNVEADLCRKEYIKDCTSFESMPGNPSECGSAFVHSQFSMALLPFGVEEVLVRDFAVCPEGAPFAGSCAGMTRSRSKEVGDSLGDSPWSRGGVLIAENNPPDGVAEFAGYKVPPTRRGLVRLTGTSKTLFLSRNELKPDCTDIVAAVRMGLPVPEWMIPLDLVKRLVADIFRESMLRMKTMVVDHWGELGYKERMAAQPEFYGRIVAIEEAGRAAPRDLGGIIPTADSCAGLSASISCPPSDIELDARVALDAAVGG